MKNAEKYILKVDLSNEEIQDLLKHSEGIITIPEKMSVTTIPIQLYDRVIKFIKDNNIGCEDTVHQCDWVIENA